MNVIINKNKRWMCTILFILLAGSMAPTAFAASDLPSLDMPFDDVPEGSWYYYLISKFTQGLITGVSENKFEPESYIRRSDFITILGRMHVRGGLSAIEEDSNEYFEDVDVDAYYGKYVNWAYKNGIVKGYNDSMFGPYDYITREQMAVVLSNYILCFIDDDPNTEYVQFNDEASISTWALEQVKHLQSYGVIAGYPDGSFVPLKNMTRVEAVKALNGMLLYIPIWFYM